MSNSSENNLPASILMLKMESICERIIGGKSKIRITLNSIQCRRAIRENPFDEKPGGVKSDTILVDNLRYLSFYCM